MQVSVGPLLLPFQEPMNPKLAFAPAARAPFQAMFWAVTVAPLAVTVAFQDWLMV